MKQAQRDPLPIGERAADELHGPEAIAALDASRLQRTHDPSRYVQVRFVDSQLEALIQALLTALEMDDRTHHQRRSQLSALALCQQALVDLWRRA